MFTKFTAVPQSPTEIPSESPCLLFRRYLLEFYRRIFRRNYRWMLPTDYPSVNLARISVCNAIVIFVGIVFFITDRNGDGIIITDAHDADGINPSEIPSVIILPTGFVPYTDGINPSAKLYNGIVTFLNYYLKKKHINCNISTVITVN
jgi:hypothetical protein